MQRLSDSYCSRGSMDSATVKQSLARKAPERREVFYHEDDNYGGGIGCTFMAA